MPPRSVPLRPRWGVLVGALLLFGGGGVFLAARAAGNDRGLIINGLIELGVANATRFYWALAALSFGFVAMAIVATLRVLGGSQVVIVEDDAVTIPGALFNAAARIAYRDITRLEALTISGQEMLRVWHAGGSSAVAAGQVGDAAFREIVELVAGRVKRVQAK